MSTTEAGDPNQFNETFPIPDGNSLALPSEFNPAYQALANRTQWLRARLLDPPLVPLFGAQQSTLGAGLVERFSPWATGPVPGFSYNERAGWLQTSVTDGGGLWWFVTISPKVVVTMVAASIDGSDGTGSNPGFPAADDRPRMRLYRQAIDGSAAVLVKTLADESADQTAYQQHHTIPEDPAILFDPPLAFAAGEHLVIEFVGHKGGLVAPGTLKLYGIKITTALPTT